MLTAYAAISLLFIHVSSSVKLKDYHDMKSCKLGEIVQNNCVKCICAQENIYQCTSKDCSHNNLRHNGSIDQSKNSCTPNAIHVLNETTCICNSKGYWPHAQCDEVFQSLPSNTKASSCEPDSYVIIDCNVCRCGPTGEVDKQRCTKNICDEVIQPTKTRRSSTTNNVYGSCIEKTWYSLAPCQFCLCVSQNKLVCNTGHYYAKKLDFGTYNLSVCGKDLIKEATELIPENERSLRYGDVKENITSNIPKATSTKEHISVSHNDDIVTEVDREKNKDIENMNFIEKDKDEYYSDSDEDKEEKIFKNILSRNGASTQYPYQDGDIEDIDKANNEESDKQDEQEGNSDNEIGVEIEQLTTPIRKLTSKKPMQNTSPKPETVKPSGPPNKSQSLRDSLKINIPMMLDTMFKMALRKSMLSLSSNTTCIPGTTKTTKCNTCFCLKNSKLLCTNNICE